MTTVLPATRLLGLLLAALWLAAAAPPTPALAADRVEEAKEDYARGVEAYEAGQYEAAVRWFRLALRHYSDPVLHFNVARCYEKLDEPWAAIDHYELAASHPDATDQVRERATEAAEDLRAASPPEFSGVHRPLAVWVGLGGHVCFDVADAKCFGDDALMYLQAGASYRLLEFLDLALDFDTGFLSGNGITTVTLHLTANARGVFTLGRFEAFGGAGFGLGFNQWSDQFATIDWAGLAFKLTAGAGAHITRWLFVGGRLDLKFNAAGSFDPTLVGLDHPPGYLQFGAFGTFRLPGL